MPSPTPHSFPTPTSLRRWFELNHTTAPELIIAFHKVHTNTPSITWPESVAEALCFGWIDGIRRRIDDDTYTIRFTPRRKNSRWSAVNLRLYTQLEAAGRMTDAGRAAFLARPDPTADGYSYEKKHGAALDDPRLRAFKGNKPAWAFFSAQPSGYQRTLIWWVMQAKRDETRDRRLAKLIAASAAGRRLM